jgi:NAD+ kinase
MTSQTGSEQPLTAEVHTPVRRLVAVTNGRVDATADALRTLEHVAREAGVEVAHDGEDAQPDLVVVLGGDGTMLRTLHRFLRTGVPVLGVNFGRVGFLTSIGPDEIEPVLPRVLAGEYVVHRLPSLLVDAGGATRTALNDVVATSSTLGRMIEVGWAVGGEDLGVQPCDGIICATPTGSTAYNLSSGGPVLVWGLDAMVVTFVAPHSLHARPLVIPRGRELVVRNETGDVRITVIADGEAFAELEPGQSLSCRLEEESGLLATPPDATFFRRYREHFAS